MLVQDMSKYAYMQRHSLACLCCAFAACALPVLCYFTCRLEQVGSTSGGFKAEVEVSGLKTFRLSLLPLFIVYVSCYDLM